MGRPLTIHPTELYVVAKSMTDDKVPPGLMTGGYRYCDGVGDDVQIQAAIDHVNANGGGVIRLSPGLFNLSDTVKVYEQVSILGAGCGITTVKGNRMSLRDKPMFHGEGSSISKMWFRMEGMTLNGSAAPGIIHYEVYGTTGGTYTLTYNGKTTAAIAHNANAAAILAALAAASITEVVTVTGLGTQASPFILTTDDTNMLLPLEMTMADSTSGAGRTVVPPSWHGWGVWVFEIGAPTSGTFTMTYDGATSGPINGSGCTAATLQTALRDTVSSIGDANVRVSGSGTASDPFIIQLVGSKLGSFKPITATSSLTGATWVAPVFREGNILQLDGAHWLDHRNTEVWFSQAHAWGMKSESTWGFRVKDSLAEYCARGGMYFEGSDGLMITDGKYLINYGPAVVLGSSALGCHISGCEMRPSKLAATSKFHHTTDGEVEVDAAGVVLYKSKRCRVDNNYMMVDTGGPSTGQVGVSCHQAAYCTIKDNMFASNTGTALTAIKFSADAVCVNNDYSGNHFLMYNAGDVRVYDAYGLNWFGDNGNRPQFVGGGAVYTGATGVGATVVADYNDGTCCTFKNAVPFPFPGSTYPFCVVTPADSVAAARNQPWAEFDSATGHLRLHVVSPAWTIATAVGDTVAKSDDHPNDPSPYFTVTRTGSTRPFVAGDVGKYLVLADNTKWKIKSYDSGTGKVTVYGVYASFTDGQAYTVNTAYLYNVLAGLTNRTTVPTLN